MRCPAAPLVVLAALAALAGASAERFIIDFDSLLEADTTRLPSGFKNIVASRSHRGPNGKPCLGKSGVAEMVEETKKFIPAGNMTIKHQFDTLAEGMAVDLTPTGLKYFRSLGVAVEEDKKVVINQQHPPWGLDRIDQADLPLDHTLDYPNTGEGVDVYVIDTGVNVNHNDFAGRIGEGYDFVDSDSDGDDCQGHGTHCAGSCCGTQYGVAKKSTIHPIRVLDCQGSGWGSDVIAGMEWAMNHENGGRPKVVSMSLGGGYSASENLVVKSLHDANVAVIVAAGNDYEDACAYSPASAPEAVTVGSTTDHDKASEFTNFGSCVDVFAPGSYIKSAWIGGADATNTISGTSMATPHVAGIAALIRAEDTSLSSTQVAAQIVNLAQEGKITASIGSNNVPNLLAQVPDGQAHGPHSPSPPPPPSGGGGGGGGGGGDCVNVQVKMTPDDHPDENLWHFKGAGKGGQLIMHGTGDKGGEACVDPGTYVFTIFDTWADGMCCGHGHGKFEVYVGGELVFEGASFASVKTAELDVRAGNPTKPVDVQVNITPDRYPSENSWEILDDDDVVVAEGTASDGSAVAELLPGKFTFIMYDTYSDGMCCGYGDGKVDVVVGGKVVFTAAEFGAEAKGVFTVLAGDSATSAPPSMPGKLGTEARSRVPKVIAAHAKVLGAAAVGVVLAAAVVVGMRMRTSKAAQQPSATTGNAAELM